MGGEPNGMTQANMSVTKYSLSFPHQNLYSKDTCLWLIDNAEAMHAIDASSGKSYVHRTIEVAAKMMEHKLIKSPHDRVGIMLFNTRDTKVPVEGKKMSYPECYAVRPIEQVAVPAVIELRDDLAAADRSSDAAAYWKGKYPPSDGQIRVHYALGNAEALLTSAGKTGSRRIFYVTNNDDPYAGRSAKTKLQKSALEKIKDMRKKGIEFEAFFISSQDRVFDVNAFYSDLFQAYDDENELLRGDQTMIGGNDPSTLGKQSWNAYDKFDDLVKDAGTREIAKRVIFRLAMELGDDFKIGVAGYNLTVRATKANPVKVYRAHEDESYQEIHTVSHLQCKDTGTFLDPDKDVYHAFALGFDVSPRSTVRFSPEEITALKTSGMSPILKVLGFKDDNSLRFWENVKHSIFIYPTESEYLGSQRAFAALLKVMLKKKRIGYGILMLRPKSIPEFVAILPQAEERNEQGAQTEPPGMHLVPLPFADDIREMPSQYQTTLEASKEETEAAGRFVKAYTRNAAFNPDFFPNPALNHHYEALKATAFGVDIEEPLDKTLPDYTGIKKRAGHLITAWQDIIEADERTRQRSNIVHASDKKRPIAFDRTEEEELIAMHMSGSIDKKVSQTMRKRALPQRPSAHICILGPAHADGRLPESSRGLLSFAKDWTQS